MSRRRASRSGLFLIELILSIFFFIIATAVVLQLFVKSHILSKDTVSINNAILYSQNMSEVFLANDGDFAKVKELYSDVLEDKGECIVILFDKDWTPITDSENTTALYSVVADYANDGSFSYLNVYVNGYSESLEYFITSGDYKSALLDTDYIYHQEVKKYNGQ